MNMYLDITLGETHFHACKIKGGYTSRYLHTCILTYYCLPAYLRTYLPTYLPTYIPTYIPTYLIPT